MDGWEDSSSDSGSRWKDSKGAAASRAAGSALSSAGSGMMSDSAREAASNVHAVSYKRGGKVKRTGLARLHKGEVVVPRGKVKRMKKAMRGAKRRR
jgi:SLT domain-containing protein